MSNFMGGKFDFKGMVNRIYALLSGPRITLSARFELAVFKLPRSDLRSTVINKVHGSLMTEVFLTMQLPSKTLLNVQYSPSIPYTAHVLVVLGEQLSKTILLDIHSTAQADFENAVHMSIVKTSPIKEFAYALRVSDSAWNISVTAGSCLTIHDKVMRFVNVKISPMPAAFSDPVAPHGLIGQSLHDRFAVQGKIDQYVPNAAGEVVTSAQGEGAIEGTMEDYEVVGGAFSGNFKFSRFGAKNASRRNVALLSGKKMMPMNKNFEAAALGDRLPGYEPSLFEKNIS